MATWTMTQAQQDHKARRLTGFVLCRSDNNNIWTVWLQADTVEGYLIDARTGANREFQSHDAAIACLNKIGVTVISEVTKWSNGTSSYTVYWVRKRILSRTARRGRQEVKQKRKPPLKKSWFDM